MILNNARNAIKGLIPSDWQVCQDTTGFFVFWMPTLSFPIFPSLSFILINNSQTQRDIYILRSKMTAELSDEQAARSLSFEGLNATSKTQPEH
jgi:hypothetical protein